MDKKSTLCLWVDGIGLSSSWSGNAFMSANPKNFTEIFSSFPSTTVSPCFNLKSEVENKEIDFARVNGGEAYLSNKTFLDHYVAKDQLINNKILKNIIDETLKRNSAVHLIGNFPSKSEVYSSFSHLNALLAYLHKEKRIQVYIHLILGDDLLSSQSDLADYLAQYYEVINKYPSIETASVSGQNNFDNNNLIKEIVEAIVMGRGTAALTLEQAFSTQKNKLPNDKLPTSIIYRDKFTFKIKNFDTVLFFNHNLSHFTSFIRTITTEMIGSLQMPKFLQVGVLFDPFYGKNTKVIAIVKRLFEDKFLSALNEHYNLSIVLDKQGLDNLTYSGAINNYRLIQFDGYELTLENLPRLLIGESKLSILYLDLASRLSSTNNFNEAEQIVKDFDVFLKNIVDYIIEKDLRLLLFSTKAGLERLSNRNIIERKSEKTISPLPFVVIDKKNKKTVSSKSMFYDMIRNRRSLVDIAPTIFDLLGISSSQLLLDRSFKKEMK